jgi:hypothetical protein
MAWDRTHVAMAGFVAATCALHVASFGESRFHLPLVPVLAVGASVGQGWRRTSASSTASTAGAPAAARTFSWRVAAVAVAIVLLSLVWLTQAGELLAALDRLRAPDGWQSALPY